MILKNRLYQLQFSLLLMARSGCTLNDSKSFFTAVTYPLPVRFFAKILEQHGKKTLAVSPTPAL